MWLGRRLLVTWRRVASNRHFGATLLLLGSFGKGRGLWWLGPTRKVPEKGLLELDFWVLSIVNGLEKEEDTELRLFQEDQSEKWTRLNVTIHLSYGRSELSALSKQIQMFGWSSKCTRCWLAVVAKILNRNSHREERFIWVHGFRKVPSITAGEAWHSLWL